MQKIKNAFSLIEVIFSLAMLSFAIISLLPILVMSVNQSKETEEMFFAASILNSVVSEFYNTPEKEFSINGSSSELLVCKNIPLPSPFSNSFNGNSIIYIYYGFNIEKEKHEWLTDENLFSQYKIKVECLEEEKLGDFLKKRTFLISVNLISDQQKNLKSNIVQGRVTCLSGKNI